MVENKFCDMAKSQFYQQKCMCPGCGLREDICVFACHFCEDPVTDCKQDVNDFFDWEAMAEAKKLYEVFLYGTHKTL